MLLIIAITLSTLQPGLKVEISGPEASIPGTNSWSEVSVPFVNNVQDELRIMPGWPKKVTFNSMFGPSRGVALADFDSDGRMEIIMPSTAGQLHVWRYDGTYYTGWPKTFAGMGQYAAAVADIDRDGNYEVAICTRGMSSGGAVYVYKEDGTLKSGWPFTGLVNGNFSDSPTLADIDGDDTLEIIVGERDWPGGHLHVLRHNGTQQPGAWPCSLDHVPALGAAVGDINLDGQKEIVYASYNSLYVFKPNGTILPGWPVTNPQGGAFSYQSPALADVDGDDTLEIIIALHREGQGTYVFRHDGTILSGWPYSFSRWTYCPPTVADLYQDNDLKIICGLSGIVGGAAAVLYGFDDDGSVLNGFPIIQPNGDAAEGNITVADIDGDGDMEIIFTSNLMSSDTLGYLFAVHHDGSPVSGWPLRPYGWTYLNGATVADVDGDDTLDIVVVSYDNGTTMAVTVYETDVPYSRERWQWPTYQFDMARTGLYQWAVTGATERHSKNAGILQITPNVLRAGGFVRLSSTPAQLPVKIYDRNGRVVAEPLVENEVLTLPRNIKQGVYFLNIAGSAARYKLVVVE
ncbi:MAG: T9SS type A sorting domain-containing protein [candidate division WOR-3 bacterium]